MTFTRRKKAPPGATEKSGKSYVVSVRLNEEQYYTVQENCRKSGRKLSDFWRHALLNAKVSDSFEYYRNNEICDEMKRKYGLTYGENKDNVKTQSLKGRPKIRQEIYLAVQAAKRSAKDWTTFQRELAQKGITVRKKFRRGSTEVDGLSYFKDGQKFKASRLTATADAPTISSARHSTEIKTDSPSRHRPRPNRCSSRLNRNRVPQQKSSKSVPILLKDSALQSVVSSKSDLPTTRKKRHSSTR